MIIEFHRNMLADKVRNEAFYQALQQVIKPGESIVADVGSGTGLLGFLASKLGAKAVYMYEYSPVIKLSQKLARHNHIPHCHFINSHSTDVDTPVKADVLVSEILGNYAYEENIIETVEDAKRFLKPGGVIIPQTITQYVAPVITSRFYDELLVWDKVGFDLDFSLARDTSLNNLYVRRLLAEDLLGKGNAQRWDSVDLNRKNKSVRSGNATWQLTQSDTIYGFAVWWECELIKGITLSTSPLANATHWDQLYFPVLQPIHANAGDKLSIQLDSDTRYSVGVNVKWQVSLQRDNNLLVEQSLDMRKGDLR
jgi:protein arginine N-methyltransferase 1